MCLSGQSPPNEEWLQPLHQQSEEHEEIQIQEHCSAHSETIDEPTTSTAASIPVTDTTSEKHNRAKAEFQKVIDDMLSKCEDPECQDDVLAFCKEYQKLRTQGSWKAGMRCFNKQNLSHSSLTAIRRKYINQRKRGYAGKMIPVQSTALSRRQPGVSRGRKQTAAGRPSKIKQANIAKAAKTNRPHNLQYCTSHNLPLGKRHSKGM